MYRFERIMNACKNMKPVLSDERIYQNYKETFGVFRALNLPDKSFRYTLIHSEKWLFQKFSANLLATVKAEVQLLTLVSSQLFYRGLNTTLFVYNLVEELLRYYERLQDYTSSIDTILEHYDELTEAIFIVIDPTLESKLEETEAALLVIAQGITYKIS